MMQTTPEKSVRGRRILVVEDEFLIAEDLCAALEDLGAVSLGPVSTVDDALAIVRSPDALDAATLDVELRREKSYPVAEALQELGLPFVFLTGYDAEAFPNHLRSAPRCQKPFNAREIAEALFGW
jgi:CheY-like chemotaxis protein